MRNIERPKFLRAKGVAKYFGIGESTVWYYLKIGKIKPGLCNRKISI